MGENIIFAAFLLFVFIFLFYGMGAMMKDDQLKNKIKK